MVSIELLREVDLFRGLSEQTLEAIAKMAQSRSCEDGEHIYQLGDGAKELFLVASGRVRSSMGVGNRPDPSGSTKVPGALFGWAALLEQEPRRVATASCLEDSTLFVIPGDKLLDLFGRDQAAGYLVMRRLATMIAQDFMPVLSIWFWHTARVSLVRQAT